MSQNTYGIVKMQNTGLIIKESEFKSDCDHLLYTEKSL